MKEQAIEKAKLWAKDSYISLEDRADIEKLLENNDTKEIVERFYKDLEFGTGGLRAILGNGRNRMNKYNIRKASQALATEINEEVKRLGHKHGKISISYDSRKFSKEFAEEVASVMAGNNIHSYLYEHLNPVCLLSFSVRHHDAHAGVMVTASHNPPEYNGYKVYWSDGAQVTPPYDQKIMNAYYNIKDWDEISYTPYEEALGKGLITLVGRDVEDRYYKLLSEKYVNPKLCQERGDDLKIVFTPIHGTGLVPCKRVLNEMGFINVFVPPEQAAPDHRFPTVKSPNPENPDALHLAVELMKKENADIVFGTDPDTDRLGVAIIKNGEVFYPNGNQIGLLMLHYILTNFKEQNRFPQNPYFVKTVVTTELQAKIASNFGVDVENTLTGFKWICGKMKEIEENEPHRNFLFATEESFGYMNHNFVRDKDGICSVALMAELALWYKTQGMDIVDALDKIYEEYGFSSETLLCLNYYGKEGAEKITRIMNHFRSNFNKEMAGQEILAIEDYDHREIKKVTTNQVEALNFPKSNVLGYQFTSGDKLYLRPSGTEPKIKFYIMINTSSGTLLEKKELAKSRTEMLMDFINKEAKKV